MELPTWKGAYCPHRVSPLSVGLFNHARGAFLLNGPHFCIILVHKVLRKFLICQPACCISKCSCIGIGTEKGTEGGFLRNGVFHDFSGSSVGSYVTKCCPGRWTCSCTMLGFCSCSTNWNIHHTASEAEKYCPSTNHLISSHSLTSKLTWSPPLCTYLKTYSTVANDTMHSTLMWQLYFDDKYGLCYDFPSISVPLVITLTLSPIPSDPSYQNGLISHY